MQDLDIFIANLKQLTITLFNEPIAWAVIGAVIGAFIILIPSLYLRRKNQIRAIRLHVEMDRKYQSLQKSMLLKTTEIADMERTCEEQKQALTAANRRITKLEESAKKTPVLEEKIERQIRQIEALTETIVSESDFGSSSASSHEPPRTPENTEPLTNEAVIEHLSNRLYEQLSKLHQQIADQSQLISTLQNELNTKTESVAKQFITKSRQLPRTAMVRFDEQVVEPIHIRVDGFKKTLKAIPNQTRYNINRIVIDPIHLRISEIKSGLNQLPSNASAQINKIVRDPLSELIEHVNRSVTSLSVNSLENFNAMVAKPIESLIDQLKMSGRSLSRETRENLNRIIIKPLETLLSEIRSAVNRFPEQGNEKINEYLVRPAKLTIQRISESGKKASIDGMRNAGNWILDSVARNPAPSAAT